jgi:hypothetical protein
MNEAFKNSYREKGSQLKDFQGICKKDMDEFTNLDKL